MTFFKNARRCTGNDGLLLYIFIRPVGERPIFVAHQLHLYYQSTAQVPTFARTRRRELNQSQFGHRVVPYSGLTSSTMVRANHTSCRRLTATPVQQPTALQLMLVDYQSACHKHDPSRLDCGEYSTKNGTHSLCPGLAGELHTYKRMLPSDCLSTSGRENILCTSLHPIKDIQLY